MSGILDHLSLGVADLEKSRAFYDVVLAPLGILRQFDDQSSSGYDVQGAPTFAFWITRHRTVKANLGLHICFAAPSRAAVDAFHAAALAAGGLDNGKPGLRPQYHANYYAAFVFDPDGHKIEAVRHAPE
jgi:catechol 2,3-dioxygenase-like lactoylglutathione lyase family enzyme